MGRNTECKEVGFHPALFLVHFLLFDLFKTSDFSDQIRGGNCELADMSTSRLHPALWKPERIDTKTETGRQRLMELQSSDAGVDVFDGREDQWLELALIREPNLRGNSEAIEAAVENWKTDRIRTFELFYYPWRRALCYVLPRTEFIELRTNRNRNRIRHEEQRIFSQKTVGVVGLSVGASFAMTMAMERGCGKMRLADFDTLALSNMNRIRSSVMDLGLPKSVVLARQILEQDPYFELEIFEEGFTLENAEEFFEGLDLVLDACDSPGPKAEIRIQAKSRRIPVLMDTSDRGMLDIERYDEPAIAEESGALHNRLSASDLMRLRTMTQWDPVDLNLFVDLANASNRGRESLSLVGSELTGWPQLYADVASGAAMAAVAARRIFLGDPTPDTRLYLSLDEQLPERIS